MKRITAWLLALGLVVTCTFPAHAGEMKDTGNGVTVSPTASSLGTRTTTTVSETDMTPTSSPEKTEGEGVLPSATPEGSGEPGGTVTPLPSPKTTPVSYEGASPSASASASPTSSADAVPSSSPSVSPSVSPSASPTGLPEGEVLPSSSDGGDWNSANASDNPRGGVEVILRNALPIAPNAKINMVVKECPVISVNFVMSGFFHCISLLLCPSSIQILPSSLRCLSIGKIAAFVSTACTKSSAFFL